MKEYTNNNIHCLMQSLGKHDPQDYQLCESAEFLIFETKAQPYYYFVQHQNKWLLLIQKDKNVYCFDPEGNWQKNSFQLLPQPEYTVSFCHSWFIYGANNENELGYTGAIAFALYHTLSQYDIDTCCENTINKKIRRGNRIAFDLKRQALTDSLLNDLYVPSNKSVAESSNTREEALEKLISQQQPYLQAHAPFLLSPIKATAIEDNPSLHTIAIPAPIPIAPLKEESNEEEFPQEWFPKIRHKRQIESDSESEDERESQKAAPVKRKRIEHPTAASSQKKTSQQIGPIDFHNTEQIKKQLTDILSQLGQVFASVPEVPERHKMKVNIRPGKRGKQYCIIDCTTPPHAQCLAEILSVQFSIADSLSLYNTALTEDKKVYLSPQQVAYLLGAPLQSPFKTNHFLFLEETAITMPSGDTLGLYCQILDRSGIDQDLRAKKIANDLNIRLNDYERKEKSPATNQSTPLFVGVDTETSSILWARDALAYQQFRKKRIASYQSEYPTFSVPDPDQTPYPDLLAQQPLSWKFFFQEYSIQREGVKTKTGLTFKRVGEEYHASPNSPGDIKQYKKQIDKLAKSYEISLNLKIEGEKLIFSAESYHAWMNILDQELLKELDGKKLLTQRQFLPYRDPLGRNYYLYPIIAGERHPADLTRQLNLQENTKDPANIFKVDYRYPPPLIFASEQDYKSSVHHRQANSRPPTEPEIKIIAELKASYYTPEPVEDLVLLQSALAQLSSEYKDGLLLTIFTLKNQLISEIIEPAEQLEATDKSLQRHNARNQLSIRLGLKETEVLRKIAELCTLMKKMYQCDAQRLHELLLRNLYPFNSKGGTNLVFNQQTGSIQLSIAQRYQIGLFPQLSYPKLPDSQDYSAHQQLKALGAQLLCAAADALVHVYCCKRESEPKPQKTALLFAPKLEQTEEVTPIRTRANAHTITENATLLLAAHRLDVITASLAFHGHTIVAQSGLENAGYGLYVKGPTTLRSGDIITWFGGKMTYEVPNGDNKHAIFLESKASKAPRAIIPNQEVINGIELGQGMRINHLPTPNCEYQNVYGKTGIIGKIVVYTGPELTLLAGEALELFTHYTKAAQNHHDIKPDTEFTATECALSTTLKRVDQLKLLHPPTHPNSCLVEPACP